MCATGRGACPSCGKSSSVEAFDAGQDEDYVKDDGGSNDGLEEMIPFKQKGAAPKSWFGSTRHECTFADCGFAAKTAGGLKKHNISDNGVDFWHQCPEDGCAYKAKMRGNITKHMFIVHDVDVEWNFCPYVSEKGEGCSYKAKQNTSIKLHLIFPMCTTLASFGNFALSSAWTGRLPAHTRRRTRATSGSAKVRASQ